MHRCCTLLAVALWATGAWAQGDPSSPPPSVQYLDERPYYDLARYVQGFELNCLWDPFARRVTLSRGRRSLTFLIDEPFVSVDGNVHRLENPPRFWQGRTMIPAEMLNWSWWREVMAEESVWFGDSAEPFRVDSVVLDAGHGGSDPGAIGWGSLREKDVTLAFTKLLGAQLEQDGLAVYTTREDDRTVSLESRSEMANRSNADLVVSIHANSAGAESANGFEIFYLSDAVDDTERAISVMNANSGEAQDHPDLPNKAGHDATLWDLILTENRRESLELAGLVQEEIRAAALGEDRGLKTASFHVLWNTDKPALLLELGFLTHPDDARRLTDQAFLGKLSRAVSRGILRYKELYEGTFGFTRPQPKG